MRFAGLIHPGILGCAPSQEILEEWNRREGELAAACTHMDRDVALPPQPHNVHAGSASDEIKKKVGKEGARTVPGRPEHGIPALSALLPAPLPKSESRLASEVQLCIYLSAFLFSALHLLRLSRSVALLHALIPSSSQAGTAI